MLKKIIIQVLTIESKLILRKYKPFIIAVTGSVGKTSTKDAIFCIIKNTEKHVRKSEKSMNSEIGLPLTIIGVPNAWKSISGWVMNIIEGLKLIVLKSEYPSCLVLEVGADHPGDISRVAKWLRPDIAVMTKISRTPVHVEFFDSPEEVFQEKIHLAKNVKKGGSIVAFADDAERLDAIMQIAKEREANVITYGVSDISNIRGSNESIIYTQSDGKNIPAGFTFKLDISGNSIPVSVRGSLGLSTMYSLLAGAGVAKARNISTTSLMKSLDTYEHPHGRMNIIEGINGSTLVDDTYNSSPDAVIIALDLMNMLTNVGKKIAVLGDMMELGKHSAEEHKNIGRALVGKIDMLLTVGPRSRFIAEEAVKSGFPAEKIKTLDRSTEVAESIKSEISAGDVILLKGSQSTRMERAVKDLMKFPERAEELLVRQEEEWLRR